MHSLLSPAEANFCKILQVSSYACTTQPLARNARVNSAPYLLRAAPSSPEPCTEHSSHFNSPNSGLCLFTSTTLLLYFGHLFSTCTLVGKVLPSQELEQICSSSFVFTYSQELSGFITINEDMQVQYHLFHWDQKLKKFCTFLYPYPSSQSDIRDRFQHPLVWGRWV